MLTRLIKTQLGLFLVLAVAAVVVLVWYFLRIPSLVGIGRYTLYAQLPQSGGLYRTANVTYRGITIGTVTAVEPTERGARATMSIDNGYQIPADASANVHSVSAVGEQYLDLVSNRTAGPYLANLQTIAKTTVPSQIGPALDAANQGLAALPKDKVGTLLHETSLAVGGLGPSLRRLVDATGAIAHDFKGSIDDIDDIIAHAGPIIDSQVDSGDDITRWSANLNNLTSQTAQQDPALRNILANAAPTADQVKATFNDVAGVVAADAGQPRGRIRHAQALPQWRRAGVGVLAAVGRDRPDGDRVKTRAGDARRRRAGVQHTTPVPDRFSARVAVAGPRRYQHCAATGRHLLQDPDGSSECGSRST